MEHTLTTKRGLVIRPFIGIGGMYLVRGWGLWLFRRYSQTLVSLGLFTLTLFSGTITSFQTGWLSIQASINSPASNPEVAYIQGAPPQPPPTVATAASPPTITVLPYIAGRRPWNSYSWGHCTYYIANRRQIPSSLGHARTWYKRAQDAGYSTGTMPRLGAIAWTPNGRFGHVALVEEISGTNVLISEMNFRGLNRISTRWVPASTFKYIY
jgi:hypothetical protein